MSHFGFFGVFLLIVFEETNYIISLVAWNALYPLSHRWDIRLLQQNKNQRIGHLVWFDPAVQASQEDVLPNVLYLSSSFSNHHTEAMAVAGS